MIVKGGATDVSCFIYMKLRADGTEATGLTISDFDMQYDRIGETPVAKVDAVALAAANTAHTDNRMIEVDPTDQPGLYRTDWPDAAFAAGVREVGLTIKHASCFTEHRSIEIDPLGVGGADLTEAGGTGDHLTDLASAAALASAAGDIAGIDALVITLTNNVNNLQATIVAAEGNVGGTGNDTTHVHVPGIVGADDRWNNHLISVYDDTNATVHYRWVVDCVASTDLFTITPALPFTPADTVDYATIFVDRCDDIDWADGGRLDLILDARASQTSVDDLPTNAELATALGTADDAVLTAIGDLPTNAELATALGTADDATLAAIAALTVPSASAIADEVETRTIAAVTTVTTVTGEVSANIVKVNSVAIDGVGTGGDPFGPA